MNRSNMMIGSRLYVDEEKRDELEGRSICRTRKIVNVLNNNVYLNSDLA